MRLAEQRHRGLRSGDRRRLYPGRSSAIRRVRCRRESGRSPAFARHLIGVIAFFGAGAAFGAMQVFKTTAQTGVPDGPVAAAVAGQLIQNTRNLGRILIDLHLPGS